MPSGWSDGYYEADRYTKVINEFNGHKKVLDIYDNSAGVSGLYLFFNPVKVGTIEFWWATTDNTKGFSVDLIGISERAWRKSVMIDLQNGQYTYNAKDSIDNIPVGSVSNNKWYHHLIYFDCYDRIFDWYIDGKLVVDNAAFFSNALNVSSIHLSSSGSRTKDYHNYFDAFGFSWDKNYNTGDNFYDGLFLQYTPNNLETMQYSLDKSGYINIKGNVVIPMPKNGTHSIQLFGNDISGNKYQSNVVRFSVIHLGIGIIRPNGDIYSEAWEGLPHWDKIDESVLNPNEPDWDTVDMFSDYNDYNTNGICEEIFNLNTLDLKGGTVELVRLHINGNRNYYQEYPVTGCLKVGNDWTYQKILDFPMEHPTDPYGNRKGFYWRTITWDGLHINQAELDGLQVKISVAINPYWIGAFSLDALYCEIIGDFESKTQNENPYLPPIKPIAEQSTLILLHGYNDDTSTMEDFKADNDYIESYGNILNIEYYDKPGGLNLGCDFDTNTPIGCISEALAQFICDNDNMFNNHVDFICHSMGGLIARYLIKEYYEQIKYHYGNKGRPFQINHVCMLGTPNHGIWYGSLVSSVGGYQTLQMQEGSDFITDLNSGDETPYDEEIDWYTYFGETSLGHNDKVVESESVILKGATNRGPYNLDHTELHNDKDLRTIILYDLDKGLVPELKLGEYNYVFLQAYRTYIDIATLTIKFIGRLHGFLTNTVMRTVKLIFNPELEMKLVAGTNDTYEVDFNYQDGTYPFRIVAKDIDNKEYEWKGDFTIIDDDVTEPYIFIDPTNDTSISDEKAIDQITIRWKITDSSGINQAKVFLNGELIKNYESSENISDSYTIQSNNLEQYYFLIWAKDNDNDPGHDGSDMLDNSIHRTIKIFDDDNTPPEINYIYTGTYSNSNSGEIIVFASDKSGLSSDPSEIYPVLSRIGVYNFTFIATDADNDRYNDSLNSTIVISIPISDKEYIIPDVSIFYEGGRKSTNPGKWTVQPNNNENNIASIKVYIDYKLVGSSFGTFNVPETIGEHLIFVDILDLFGKIGSKVDYIFIREEFTDIIRPNEDCVLFPGEYQWDNPPAWNKLNEISPNGIYIQKGFVRFFEWASFELGFTSISNVKNVNNLKIYTYGGMTENSFDGFHNAFWRIGEGSVNILYYLEKFYPGSFNWRSYYLPVQLTQTQLDNFRLKLSFANAHKENYMCRWNWDTVYIEVTYFKLDTSAPIIDISFIKGDGTTQNLDRWHVITKDDESGLNRDMLKIYIDNELVKPNMDYYLVPNEPGEHVIKVEAENYDGIKNIVTKSINIEPLDSTPPEINITYTGDLTDENSGTWNVKAFDLESGINESSINIFIDNVLVGNLFGEYNVPKELGIHKIYVIVENNVQLTNSCSNSINIVDDDISPPEISCIYTGDGSDANPGEIIVSAYDDSGLTEDPSGTYTVPNEPGTYSFTFTAIDIDNDRPNDSLTTNKTITIIIVDDDINPPEISCIYTGDGSDANPGEIIVSAYDESGLSEDPSGTYTVPNEPGTYSFTFTAIDSDNDRPNDFLTTNRTIYITIIDDDITPPDLSDLEITHDILYVYVSFKAIDESGIGDIEILVNGENINPINQSVNGSFHLFVLFNQWILKNDKYIVEILVLDADCDRLNDSLTSSINGTFEIKIIDLYNYIDWQLENLKTYIQNKFCCFLNCILSQKLFLAQKHLAKAYSFFEDDRVICELFHYHVAIVIVQITELQIELFNRISIINEEDTEYIVESLHEIRNNIVILIGASVGTEKSYNLALVEVEIFKIRDIVDNQKIGCYRWKLTHLICQSITQIELAIIKIALNRLFNHPLIQAYNALELAKEEVDNLLKREKISQQMAEILTSKLNQTQYQINSITK